MLTELNFKSFVLYKPETGSFTWIKIDTKNQTKVGDEIGSIRGRYKVVSFNGRYFYIHRVIYLYMTGEWPEDQKSVV